MMTMPLNLGEEQMAWIEVSAMRVEVGFPGEQRKMSLMLGSAAVASRTFLLVVHQL